METMYDNLFVTALLLGGMLVHDLGKAREIDRATPEREPLAAVLAEVMWGDDARWRTIVTVVAILAVGLSGSADSALAMAGVQIGETSGKVLIYGGAGYSIDSIGKKLQAVMAPKVSA
ncbi:MAG: hypothetical protein NUW01_01430 [Gemmatimonadaceae bacterium]|nr:hypothetical protein [Gemmatimonadaceae bacterium]